MNEDQVADPSSGDLYAALQVSPAAETEIVEAAYRVLARRFHPDRNHSPNATARMALINRAWDTLRDPERRAAYDRERAGEAQPAPATPAPEASAPVERAGPAPALVVEPDRVRMALRRGARRSCSISAYTVPPGIRVEAAVTNGARWLHVEPAVLKGLVKEDLTLSLQTQGVPPGRHQGAVRIVTSWETRVLPVELQVRPASLPYRLATLLRYGPSGQGSTVPLLLGLLLLLAIVGALAVLAVGR
jgi:hypothetical protein